LLFDPAPKSSRRDFFDREAEIERVKSLSSPITLVLGLRRTGKSSVIMISLNELGLPYIYVDLRKFEEKGFASYRDLVVELEREVNRLTGRFPGLLEVLRRVEGVEVMGSGVRLRWGGRRRVTISSLLEALNDWAEDRVVFVIDEAQELINMRGANLLPALAYSFDNLRRVRVVLSGSKMGLLYRYLGVEDPRSPLYGRAMNEVELKPFSREMAEQFLRLGLSELGIEFREYDMVYDTIGGIPGWLTYFGYYYGQDRDLGRALERTLRTALGLIREEFESFLRTRYIARERYLAIMRAVSRCATWSEIRRALEASEGARVSDSELSNYLTQLIDSSWIVKTERGYCPSEPLIGKAFGG